MVLGWGMTKRDQTNQPTGLLIAGDIGGTKTHLAIFSVVDGPRTPLATATFPSQQYTGLEVIVQEFLAQTGMAVTRACFDVAGPVLSGHATITNLPWEIDEGALRDFLRIDAVRLLNDLEALAYAVPMLQADDVYTLHAGSAVPHGTIAVVAPGTGLGEAFLTWDGAGYRAYPSEGGHTDFAPLDELQDGLLRYMRQRYAHVSVERVCSGIGIANMYDYIVSSGYAVEVPAVAARLAVAEDRTPLIIEAALHADPPSPCCAVTLDMFIAMLGAEAGNFALKTLATGGVYLGGGIPPRLIRTLEQGLFLQSFRAKGRFTELLSRVPVVIITNPNAALLGAAHVGLTHL